MLIIERAAALAGVSIFEGLHDHVLADVARVVHEVTVEMNDVIIEEGRYESWMFALIEGSAVVESQGVELARLGRGAAIGELAMLDPGPRAATVTALEPGLLFRLDQPAFREVMVEQPELASGLLTMLVRRLRAANERRTAPPS